MSNLKEPGTLALPDASLQDVGGRDSNNIVRALLTDSSGRVITNPNAGANGFNATSAAAITGTASTQVVAAGGAGVRRVVTSISVVNESATATRVDILDGATVVWRFWASSAVGTQTVTFPDGLRLTANTAINAQCSVNLTSTFVSIKGFNEA